jgi:hypothetical protein
MTLLGSIAKLQNQGIQFYSSVAQVFGENNLIRETWLSMALDLKQQVDGLESLPHSFWSQLKDEEAGLRESIQGCWKPHSLENDPDRTLRHFLCLSLEFEEPLILKVYVPLIRHLRADWSGQELDLYIMVKAHVARLLQVIRSFSGDPISIHRVVALIETFEKKVQVPNEPTSYRAKRGVLTAVSAATRKPQERKKEASRHSRKIEKRSIPKQREALLKVPRRAHR